jgi:type I restriction enzyme S subunit
MAGEWKGIAFGKCAQRVSDVVQPQQVAERTPYIGLEHIVEGGLHLNGQATASEATSAKTRFCRGDVLFGKLRPYFRKVVRPKFDGICSTDIWAVRAKNGVDQGFLFYRMASQEFVDKSMGASTGTRMPRADWGFLSQWEMPLPPLTEQKAIASVLGALDDKIELNRRINATLEAMARALFQSWFVDFDPVRAKLDGRKPIGLDETTAALFPDSFQESAVGHIPHGWEVKTIEELAERVAMGPFGSDIKVSTFVPEGIPVVSGQHLRGTLLDDSKFNFVSVEHADRLKRSNVQRGDVIFTHAGSIGQVAYIPEASRYERYIVSQRQFYMRCNRALVSPFYITSYFKTPEGQHRLLANTSSTGVPSISQPVTYLRQLKMVVPPPALLRVFDTTVREIHLKMVDNDHQSRTLATLRDTLLPKLLSGELGVGDTTFNTGANL